MNTKQVEVAINFLKQYGKDECFAEFLKFQNTVQQKPFSLFAERCANLISFWKLCRFEFPNLAKFAIKLMIIPAGTALLESLFSNWTYVHNQQRNKLSNEKSAKLVNIYYSLKFMDLRKPF